MHGAVSSLSYVFIALGQLPPFTFPIKGHTTGKKSFPLTMLLVANFIYFYGRGMKYKCDALVE